MKYLTLYQLTSRTSYPSADTNEPSPKNSKSGSRLPRGELGGSPLSSRLATLLSTFPAEAFPPGRIVVYKYISLTHSAATMRHRISNTRSDCNQLNGPNPREE